MKDSPLSLGFITQVVYGAAEAGIPFEFIAGTSTGWLPLYHMGVRAAIAGMNNWAPEIMTELVRATFAGEWDRARLAYLVMMSLSAKLHFAIRLSHRIWRSTHAESTPGTPGSRCCCQPFQTRNTATEGRDRERLRAAGPALRGRFIPPPGLILGGNGTFQRRPIRGCTPSAPRRHPFSPNGGLWPQSRIWL